MNKQTIAILLALSCVAAQAQDEPKKLGFVGGIGLNVGGDSLVSGSYANGGSYDVKAGGGLALAGGLTYALNPLVDLQATVGYESDSTNATNGKIQFKRMPMEFLGFYRLGEKYRLGGGIRKANSAKLSSSGAASSVGNYDFNASTGMVLELQYMINGAWQSKTNMAIYGRYVAENFTLAGDSEKISGNHVGLGVAFYFR